MITRSNVGKELSDVASCDHIDLAACWSCGTISSANLETINSNSTGVMDIRVRRLLLAAAESDATVESGHICPLRRQRPTPPSHVRMTSWPPTLPCGRWPPLRPRFCTTAQIRGFLSTPAARYGRTLRVSWRAQAAPPTDFYPGSAQPAAWTIQGGCPGAANVAPRVQFQAVWLGNEAPATVSRFTYVVGWRGGAEYVRRQPAAKRWARGGRRWRSGRAARRAPCRAQQPSARNQPLDRQSLNVEFIKQFRLTLSHEGTTHCDLSKLRARHTKRHMNEGNAKKGPEYHTADGRGLPAHERVLVSILQNKNTVGVEEARQWDSRLSHINQAP